ncbi:MAG: histidinol-phosphatase [Hyphomicrobiaceae bacterium]
MTGHQASPPSLSQLIDLAHELADLSGQSIRPYFRRRLTVENKAAHGGFDPVTKADRAAERVIRKTLRQRFPEHGFNGEEYGTSPTTGSFVWVVDPIDGTRAFIMGSPLWGTLIGLLDGEQAVLGVMDQPYTRERFWSGTHASHWRGAEGTTRRLQTRPCARLADAIFCTTHPGMFASQDEQSALHRIAAKVRMMRYGGDCYAYCLLAAGHIDLIVETGLKPHDIVALIPIVERAGGRVSTWEGGSAIRGGRIVAAGDERLHQEAIRVLAP